MVKDGEDLFCHSTFAYTYVYNVSNMNSLNTILKKLYYSFSQAVYSKEAQWSKNINGPKKGLYLKPNWGNCTTTRVQTISLYYFAIFSLLWENWEPVHYYMVRKKRLRSKRFASCQFNWNSKPVKILHAREYYIGMEDLVNI